MTAKFLGTFDELKSLFALRGIAGQWNERPNGVYQLKCGDGIGINWSATKGTIWFDGKESLRLARESEVISALESSETSLSRSATGASVPRKVFVVYGHDNTARNELEAMLRRWDLEPVILDQLTSGGKTIIEKLESARREVSFSVVLATPDDEGHRKGAPGEKSFRCRQNVVLELGMMLSVVGREKTAILFKTSVEMERPSDIQGLIYIAYKDNVSEAALILAKEMNAQGIPIDLKRI